MPPHAFFLVSAVFHYLGPSLAVLLFARVDVLGVTWLRIASAAAIFALWRRPWRVLRRLDRRARRTLVMFGVVLAAMNTLFYLAIDRLPLATVGAIEFLGPIALAAYGIRTRRNAAALASTVLGVVALTELRFAGAPLGFACAFGNCALFVLYVALGHRIANAGDAAAADPMSSIDRLGAAMLIATIAVTPIGLRAALPAFTHPALLAAGLGVGLCSSVIPYVCDQLAMARLPRASFALMLALLPVFAVLIGAVVLHQIPNGRELAGIGLVAAGIAIHQRR
ncbi:MAG: EamA family transporter [Proteobacteria bacterium]|nr:EamA family transporter [Pseudomonadota bacterium]